MDRRMLRVVGAVAPEVAARLASATVLDTLEDVLRAHHDIAEVVVQDEYCHDVVVPVAGGSSFLVFDTT
jgi:hypothetical protein